MTVGSGVGRGKDVLNESCRDDCEGVVVEGVSVGSCVDTCEGVTSVVDNWEGVLMGTVCDDMSVGNRVV